MTTRYNRMWMKVALMVVLGAATSLGTPAMAAPRTWVSVDGDDGNSCSRAAPCRNFFRAINATDAGGEINCADAADYGPVTITKALTISCNGLGKAGGEVSNNSILVNAGATDIVTIDGLEITGGGKAQYGIVMVGGAGLIVRNSTIRNFKNYGIFVYVRSDATLDVDNTAFINNAGAGINFAPYDAAAVRASVSGSKFSNNGYGLYVSGTSTSGSVFASLQDVRISNSLIEGIHTYAGDAKFATVALDGVLISGSTGAALSAQGSKAGMLVNNTTVTNNRGGGLNAYDGGVIYSFGNNRVNGNNAKDGSFTGTLPQR